MNTGVFSAELPLSESPVLGDWTITAEVGDEVKFQSFFFSPLFKHIEQFKQFNTQCNANKIGKK